MTLAPVISLQTFVLAFCGFLSLVLIEVVSRRVMRILIQHVKGMTLGIVIYTILPTLAVALSSESEASVLLLALAGAYVIGFYPENSRLSPSFHIIRLVRSRESKGGISHSEILGSLDSQSLLTDRIQNLTEEKMIKPENMSLSPLGRVLGGFFYYYRRRVLGLPRGSG